jgi:Thermolysin metallopeptidase, alpha-helical domain/Thermolysin metallopeptidase, catalytic domain
VLLAVAGVGGAGQGWHMPSSPLPPSRSPLPQSSTFPGSTQPAHCSIVPPYLLEALASSDDPRAAEHAQATLDVDAELRQSRRTSGLRADRTSRSRAPRKRLAPGTTAGPVRAIHDAEHGTTLPGTLVRSEGDPDTGDQAVSEAYDGLGGTWQLWQETYGRNSLDGKGLPLVASVHFGTNYDNAFWDGTQMVFGDGDGVIFLPFTRSVDVIGHELAHGVTQYTSGLNYQDQSGALNESVSDVFGVLVKQRLLGQTADQADWLIGAELLAPGVNGVALRSMAAPGTAYDDPRLGKDPQPAHLSGYVDTTDDNGGVHINSGIPNKAFHVVATTLGGNAWEVAGQVWVDTITGDISADCDFATFARLTVAAATARHGADSEVVAAVRAGWDAVGVASELAAPASPTTAPRPGSGTAPAPDDDPSTPTTPGPATEVSLRRTGGIAGRTLERTVVLGELPNGDARAWHSLLADDGLPALADAIAGGRNRPDAFCYGVRCVTPPLDVLLPEPGLPDDVRSLLERTLGGAGPTIGA